MKRKIITIALSAALAISFSLPTYAANLTIDRMTMEVPDSWIEIENEVTEDGATQITYSCGNGYMKIFTNPYDESMSDMSDILLDAALDGIKQTDEYLEVDSSNADIGGGTAHTTTFRSDGNAGMLVSLDTGASIANFLYMCPSGETDEFSECAEFLDSLYLTDSAESMNDKSYTKYTSGTYKVGTDLPPGEYIVFADGGTGYFCVSADSNQDDIIFNDNFEYNSIITVNDGEYLDLTRCYAIPFEEEPEVEVHGEGMFKVGTHIPSGEYKLITSGETGYYCIYPDSRQDDIISNDNFEGQNYVTVSDGQYLVLVRCKFTEPPEKPVKAYTDAETVEKVQEALNTAGYDCGAPDGIAGSVTQAQIEKYQEDKGLRVTGAITDEVLQSLGV